MRETPATLAIDRLLPLTLDRRSPRTQSECDPVQAVLVCSRSLPLVRNRHGQLNRIEIIANQQARMTRAAHTVWVNIQMRCLVAVELGS